MIGIGIISSPDGHAAFGLIRKCSFEAPRASTCKIPQVKAPISHVIQVLKHQRFV